MSERRPNHCESIDDSRFPASGVVLDFRTAILEDRKLTVRSNGRECSSAPERQFLSSVSRNREYFSRNFAFGNRDDNFTGFPLPTRLQGSWLKHERMEFQPSENLCKR